MIITDHSVEQTLEIVDRAYIMYEGGIKVTGSVSELVWSDEVAEIYLGPTLTARMRTRFDRPAMVEAIRTSDPVAETPRKRSLVGKLFAGKALAAVATCRPTSSSQT